MPDISISRGAGSTWLTPGTYDASFASRGYTGATLTPLSCTVPNVGTAEEFDIQPSGTATITVNDENGDPLTGVEFKRSYNASTAAEDLYTPIGDAVTDNTDGTYTIKYLPFDAVTAGYNVYFNLSKDGYTADLITIEMNAASVTPAAPYVLNSTTNESVTVTEGMYSDFPIINGTLTLTPQ